MSSLNPLIVLLAVAVAMYLLTRLTKHITPKSAHTRKLPQLGTCATDDNASDLTWAESKSESGSNGQSQSPQDRQTRAPSEQNIVIDADRPAATRAIEPDLAAALDQADAEIRQADDQVIQASTGGGASVSGDHPLHDNVVLLEPRDQHSGNSHDDGVYGRDVSISDAELIEPETVDSEHNDKNAQHTFPEPGQTPSEMTTLQVESNSAQLMLIDSYTDLLIGTENLTQSIQRITQQSGVNRLTRSKINAEQQRKLILANARAEKQRTDIETAKKARLAGEKLIGKQQSEIERIRAQMANMKQTLLLKQTQLEKQQLQLARSQTMARSAAKLARRAAITQQQAKDAAETEKKLRHKVEGRTQQAISIAKNAITALAEEEKKNKVDSVIN